MRDAFARCVVAIGAGFAVLVGLMAAQGCKKQAAPVAVQQAVRSVARVQPNFSFGSLPVEDVDTRVTPRVDRGPRRQQQVQSVQVQPVQEGPVPVQSVDAQAAAAEEQRQQDEMLLEQQQAESDRQQEELNRDIEETLRMQEEVQAEPRIQDNPGPVQSPVETSPMEPEMVPPMPPQ